MQFNSMSRDKKRLINFIVMPRLIFNLGHSIQNQPNFQKSWQVTSGNWLIFAPLVQVVESSELGRSAKFEHPQESTSMKVQHVLFQF